MCPLAGSTEVTMLLFHTLIYTAIYTVHVPCQRFITKLPILD